MYVTTDSRRDGLSTFEVVRFSTHYPGTENMLVAPQANGYLQGPESLQWYAENQIRTAQKHGVPLQVVLHQSPDSYGFGDRFDRYLQVVEQEAHDEPVILHGHSWGWAQALTAAELLNARGMPIHSAQGVAPNSLTPLTVSLRSLTSDIPRLLKAAYRESETQAEIILQEGISMEGCALSALKRLAKHVIKGGNEGFDILTRDNVQRTVDLNNKLGVFTTIFGCRDDDVCPHDIMRDNLLSRGFPEAQFKSLDTCHTGAVLQRQHVPRLFSALVMREMVERQPLAAA